MPIVVLAAAVTYKAFDLSGTALVIVTILFSLVAMYVTDPVGFGLREDPEVRRRRERSA